MDAVGDQPGRQRADVERRADQARLAVADLAHRVEQMRDHRGAGLGMAARRRVAGVGMAEADDDAGARPAPRSARGVTDSGATVVSSTGRLPARRDQRRLVGLGHRPDQRRIMRALAARSRDAGLRDAGRESRARLRRAASTPAAMAARVISGVSVISVGSSAVVPNGACAAQIVRIASTSWLVVEHDAAAAIDLQVDEARRQHAAAES